MKLNPDRKEKKSWTKKDKNGSEQTWEWEEHPDGRAYHQAQATKTLQHTHKNNTTRKQRERTTVSNE